MNETRPYQVLLYVGTNAPVVEGVTVVDLTPASSTADAVLERLKDSGLTPADLRSRVLFATDVDVDGESATRTVMVYSALLGFAGRRIDIAVGDDLISTSELDDMARALPDSGRPDPIPEHVQVGAVDHGELPSVGIRGALGPDEVSLVRFARRVRFVPAPSPLVALTQLLVVAGVRQRNRADRLPFLCDGTEPAEIPADAETDTVGICLDTLRRAAVDLRRTLRPDNRSELADRAELSARQRQLLAAAAQPIEITMLRLGANVADDGEQWHCTRPERHNNGDANPSMKVVRGKVRCFRCDAERVDSLRLAMDTRDWSADEAATFLLQDHDTVLPASVLAAREAEAARAAEAAEAADAAADTSSVA